MQPVRFDEFSPAQLKPSTVAIVYRIIQVTRITGNRGLRRICHILVESAAPYTLTSAVILVTYQRAYVSLVGDILNSTTARLVRLVPSITMT